MPPEKHAKLGPSGAHRWLNCTPSANQELEFTDRVRWICQNECPMYNKSWACPPAVGTVTYCKAKCRMYENALLIS